VRADVLTSRGGPGGSASSRAPGPQLEAKKRGNASTAACFQEGCNPRRKERSGLISCKEKEKDLTGTNAPAGFFYVPSSKEKQKWIVKGGHLSDGGPSSFEKACFKTANFDIQASKRQDA